MRVKDFKEFSSIESKSLRRLCLKSEEIEKVIRAALHVFYIPGTIVRRWIDLSLTFCCVWCVLDVFTHIYVRIPVNCVCVCAFRRAVHVCLGVNELGLNCVPKCL